MKYIHYANQVPKEQHYAILEFSTIHIPGDERSKSAPGHGYPARTQEIVNYIVCDSKEEWEKDIERRSLATVGNANWSAIIANPAKIKKNVEIEIE